MRTILNLFGCEHKNTSWPLSMRNGRKVPCYVTCNSCGKEFNYDFDAMRIVQEVKKAPIKQRKLAPVVDIGEVRRVAR